MKADEFHACPLSIAFSARQVRCREGCGKAACLIPLALSERRLSGRKPQKKAGPRPAFLD
ncbi:MAG: hypothetical protein AAFZ99_03210 [Pseudomonadota bacterium]